MTFPEFREKFESVTVDWYPTSCGEDPMVTICVQTFKHATFIRQCLDSILVQQTNFEFQIQLGEDGSVDGTREICVDYAKKYPDKIRLFLHHRENNITINGMPTGRFNFLYNLFTAKGKYVALCEGDDYWTDPKKLQKQVDIMEASDHYVACFHDVSRLTNKGLIPSQLRFLTPDNEMIASDVELKDIISRKWIIPTCSFLFRRDKLILNNSFLDFPNGDFLLFVELSKSAKFLFIPEIMGVYRKNNPGNATNNRDIRDRILIGVKKIRLFIDLQKRGILNEDPVVWDVIEKELEEVIGNANVLKVNRVLSGYIKLVRLLKRIRFFFRELFMVHN